MTSEAFIDKGEGGGGGGKTIARLWERTLCQSPSGLGSISTIPSHIVWLHYIGNLSDRGHVSMIPGKGRM